MMHEPNKPPQRTRRAQSAAIRYEMVLQRNRTRMTRIGRIFTDNFDPCASVSSVKSVFHPEYNEPQINADERRYRVNNELVLTDTNSNHSEFVRVRISSLLISVLRLLFAPAHERAPLQPAPRRSSAVEPRGGMSVEGGRMMEIGEMPEGCWAVNRM